MLLLLYSLFLSANSLEILHLADFHMDVDYSTHGDNTKMCHEGTGSKKMNLGTYGDYMCDSPQSLVAYTLDEARRVIPNPDVVLWTGDNIPHVDGYNWEYVFNAVNITTNLLLSRFSKVPHILPTFGNHDYAPANAYDQYSNLYEETWKIWKDLIGEDQKATFLKGGYYKYRLPNATVLVLNTNLYYNVNSAYENFTDPFDPAGMFNFMENELNKAEHCPAKVTTNCTSAVHIVAHIPPGVFERTPSYTWFRPQYNERYLNITVRYQKTIKWMLYGHHHTDTFHLVKDSAGKTVQLSLMSPAVTPWFSSLPGAGANNPAFRIYRTDSMNNINDISTYYVNLDQLNNQSNTSFQFEYSFKDAYGLQGPINADSMSVVLESMKNNDTAFMKYITFNSVMWKPSLPKGKLRGAQLCSIEFSDYPRYNQCLLQYNSTSIFSIIPAVTLAVVHFILQPFIW